MALQIKPGVKLLGIRPELAIAAQVVASVFAGLGLDAIITSGIDGQHKRASAHYSGRALDFRIRHIPGYEQQKTAAPMVVDIAKEIAQALGDDFDALLEVDHLHIEYDPKLAPEVVRV